MTWNLDPIAFSIFGLPVRWYGLAYILGFFILDFLGQYIAKQNGLLGKKITKDNWDTLLFGVFICGILGGRLGEFIFFSPQLFLANPFEVLQIWHGGMSIHGGLIGAILFIWWFARQHKITVLQITNTLALPMAIALGFGRIANFINGELVGVPTGSSWGIIFPHVDELLRHPTQLYESASMFVLAALLWLVFKKHPKHLTAFFLFGYGFFRFIVEFWKDVETVFIGMTMGQTLCLIMMIAGVFLFFKKPFKS